MSSDNANDFGTEAIATLPRYSQKAMELRQSSRLDHATRSDLIDPVLK